MLPFGCRLARLGRRQCSGRLDCHFRVRPQDCDIKPCPIDCVGDYGDWGACSVPCGGGTQERSFEVKQPDENGGAACPPAIDTQACSTNPCPVDCMGTWGEFGTCVPGGDTCTDGAQTRTYTVTAAAANGGTDCEADDGDVDTEDCSDIFPGAPCAGGTCTASGACAGAGLNAG